MATVVNSPAATAVALPTNLKDARAELFFSIVEHEHINNVRRHLDNVLRLGGNINDKYSVAAGDDFDAFELIIEAIITNNMEAFHLLLAVEHPRHIALKSKAGLPLMHCAAASAGTVEFIEAAFNYTRDQIGISAHCYHDSTLIGTLLEGIAIPSLLEESEVSYQGQPPSAQLKKEINAFRLGKNESFIPTSPIVFKYWGPINAVQWTAGLGVNANIKNVHGLSPLEVAINPAKYATAQEQINRAFPSAATQVLRVASPTTVIFKENINSLGASRKSIPVTVEYNFSQLATILNKVAKDPNNQGGHAEVAQYYREREDAKRSKEIEDRMSALKEQQEQHAKSQQELHNAHVLAQQAAMAEMKSEQERKAYFEREMKEEADSIALKKHEEMEQALWDARFDAATAQIYAVYAQREAEEAKKKADAALTQSAEAILLATQAKNAVDILAVRSAGAIEATEIRQKRAANIAAIKNSPTKAAMFSTLIACLKGTFQAAMLMGDPSGIKLQRAKTKTGDAAATIVKAVTAQIPGAGTAGAAVAAAISAGVDYVEKKKAVQILKSVPEEAADSIAVDIALKMVTDIDDKTELFDCLDNEHLDQAKTIKLVDAHALKYGKLWAEYLSKYTVDPNVGIVKTLTEWVVPHMMAAHGKLQALLTTEINTNTRKAAAKKAAAPACGKENLPGFEVAAGRGRSSAVSSAADIVKPASSAGSPASPTFTERLRKMLSA